MEDLRAKLKKAEERATEAERALQSAEDRARDAVRQRDAAEEKARNAVSDLAAAFKQQVKDARILGEQEGRKALQHEFEDVINKARNDGYRDAMTYLDDRATTARESGAKEERARIANMGFFERRRYLNIHVA